MIADLAPTAAREGFWQAPMAAAREAWTRYRVYNRTLTELNALSSRDLDDLGISRCMISRLAHEAAYGSKG